MTKPRKRSGSPPAPLPAKRLRRQCRGPFWNRHKLCAHCGKSLRKATRDKHYAEYPDQDRDDSETDDACDCLCETASEGDDNSDAASPAATTHNFFAGDEALLDALRDDLAGARTRKSRQPREDTPRATQFSEDAPYEANSTLDYASEDDEFIVDADAEYNEVEDEEIEQPGLAEMEAELEDMLLADAEQQLFEKRASHLTEKDRTNIRMFILKLVANMPRFVFNLLRTAFADKLEIDSEWVILHRIAILSGIQPVYYDCCVRSCMAFTGEHANRAQCIVCKSLRWNSKGKARRKFCYLPLIPRLQGFFQSPSKITELEYLFNYVSVDGQYSDMPDGAHYKRLCRHRVVVDGEKLPHRYFSAPTDIALGLCTDSFLLFPRRKEGCSATPLLAQIYNLPPNVRTHLEAELCAGLIPGPRPPKLISTFTFPIDEELAKLARGVKTHNAKTGDMFDLHAYLMFILGDILAASKMLNNTGVNGFCACPECEIRGHRNVVGKKTNFNLSLARPNDGVLEEAWNPENIPARTEKSFRAAEDRLNAAAGNDAKLAQLKRDYGVKGPPALGRVGSLSRPVSYPWDIMHLFFENIIPGLVKLWTGGKRFPVGDESYVLSPETVNEIWDETSAAFHHIPSSFVRSLAGAPEKFTAEATAFWFIYLMPALLKGRLPAEHYKHACLLVKIIKLCLQFTITDAELTNMRRYIIQWVREHERLYFQYYEQRLSVCTLPIHGLLHVPGNIRNCGPSWTTWTFFMERYCGFLKLAVKSKRIPWANLTKRILYFAYLEQIAVRWDLTQEMALFGRVDRNSVSAFEHRYEHYPDVILRAPYQKARLLSTQARSALAAYLAPVLQVKKRTIEGLLPAEVRRWGKFRLPDGDCFRAAAIFERGDETLRDNTYVRFYKQTRTTDDNDRAVWAPVLAYGRLEEILECPLPKKTVLAKYSGKIGLFAVITPCKTSGRDASEKLVSYREEEAMVVVDLDNVRATVGRVWSREKWTIIDRSQGLVKPDFVPLALMPEEDGGVEAT